MGTVVQSDRPHLVVTGAGGFLGEAIIRAALARGLAVTGILRGPARWDASALPNLTLLTHDLAQTDVAQLAMHLDGADAIVHAAGEMSSDAERHARSTLPATQTVCQTAAQIGAHLVHISSISVYDYMQVDEGGFLNEDTPIERAPEARDGYVAAKLEQEAIVAQLCPEASVLRVGALLGPGRGWNAHLGIGAGPVLLQLAARGQVPVCDVRTCAEIAIQAALGKAPGAVNVLDKDLPTRTRFVEAFAKSGWPRLVVPVPWKLLDVAGRLLGPWAGRPGLLRRAVLHARIKPIGYDTARLEAGFDVPDRSFGSAMREALRDD